MPNFDGIETSNKYTGGILALVRDVKSKVSKSKNCRQVQTDSAFKGVNFSFTKDVFTTIKAEGRNLPGAVTKIVEQRRSGNSQGRAIEVAGGIFTRFSREELTKFANIVYGDNKYASAPPPPRPSSSSSAPPPAPSRPAVPTRLTAEEKINFPDFGTPHDFIDPEVAVPDFSNAFIGHPLRDHLTPMNPHLEARPSPQGAHLREEENEGQIFEYDLRQVHGENHLLEVYGRNDRMNLRHHSLFGHYDNRGYHMAKMKCHIEATSSSVIPNDLKVILTAKGINPDEARVSFRIWEAPIVGARSCNRLNVITHTFAESQSQNITSSGAVINLSQQSSVSLGIFGTENMSEAPGNVRAPFNKMGDVNYCIHSVGPHGGLAASPNNAHVMIDPTKPASCWMVVKKGNRWEVTHNHFLSQQGKRDFENHFERGAPIRETAGNTGVLLQSLNQRPHLQGIARSMIPFLTDIPSPNVSRPQRPATAPAKKKPVAPAKKPAAAPAKKKPVAPAKKPAAAPAKKKSFNKSKNK
jgi:hypothetical protein